MNKKTILIHTIALGLLGGAFSNQVFAEEAAALKEDTKEAQLPVKGHLGERPTEPENPENPEAPEEEWIKVVLPVTTMFYSSENRQNIESSDEYEIINESEVPVTVRINNYTITGGGSVKALDTLSINRDRGQGNYKKVAILDEYNSGAYVGKHPVNRDFVTLANKDGQLADGTDGDSSTNFYYTGHMSKGLVNAQDPTIDSHINFKFTAINTPAN